MLNIIQTQCSRELFSLFMFVLFGTIQKCSPINSTIIQLKVTFNIYTVFISDESGYAFNVCGS